MMDTEAFDMPLEKVHKLTSDMKEAAKTLSRLEARYVVSLYYRMQEYRIATSAMIKKHQESGEPHSLISSLMDDMRVFENEIKKGLEIFASNDPVGRWSMSVCGIGPVIAAGLLAHIDIERACTAGHVWSFAGLNPAVEWGKGEKRPWNAALKVICWKAGQSFVKVSGRDKDVYGKIYKVRKAYEVEKNEKKMYADQAAAKIKGNKIGKETVAYKFYSDGLLPPAHIQQRAERYAVKLFLSHWHHVAYWVHYGTEPPKPYPIGILNHAHEVDVPSIGKCWDCCSREAAGKNSDVALYLKTHQVLYTKKMAQCQSCKQDRHLVIAIRQNP